MTTIEWTHVPDGKGGRKKGETVNPQTGCSEKSPGCRNCYAARVAHRGMSKQHRGLTVLRSNGPHWNGEIARAPDQLEKPLRWRQPRGIFWGSMTDLFHESVMATDDGRRYIAACFGVMAATPQHTHMVVTKRPHLMREWFEWIGGQAAKLRVGPGDTCDHIAAEVMYSRTDPPHPIGTAWPLSNVWLITTTEDQQRADERIPHLLACPAAVRGLSVEPMLSPVSLPQDFLALGKRSWVICGGESGQGARPMHPDWARSLRDQCVAAGVPYFFKQHGAWAEVDSEAANAVHGRPGALDWTHMVSARTGRAYGKGDDMPISEVAGSLTFMRKVGKSKSGRELDGRTWDEFPEVSA